MKWRIIMKNEIVRKDNPSQSEEGFPIQALLMLGMLGFALIAIVLKVMGVF
jgi:hypothetical protein